MDGGHMAMMIGSGIPGGIPGGIHIAMDIFPISGDPAPITVVHWYQGKDTPKPIPAIPVRKDDMLNPVMPKRRASQQTDILRGLLRE